MDERSWQRLPDRKKATPAAASMLLQGFEPSSHKTCMSAGCHCCQFPCSMHNVVGQQVCRMVRLRSGGG